MQATLMGRDIYVRHTAVDGKAFVQQHRVWDADRFLKARGEEAAKANADEVKKGKEGLARVEQITLEQFVHERQRS